MMTAKEYLSQYRLLNNEIDAKIEQLSELRGKAESVAPSLSGGKTNGVSDKVGRTVAKIIDLENEINDKIDKLVETKHDIEQVIRGVEEQTLRLLLEYRYINGLSFEQISCKLNYSYLHVVHRLHPKALEKVKDVIECNINPLI